MSPPTTPAVARARVAHRTRYLGADHPTTVEARSQLAEANLAAYIRRIVDAAPPLSQEQRERLAILLRPAIERAGGTAA